MVPETETSYEVIRDALFRNGEDQFIVKSEPRDVIIVDDDSEDEPIEFQHQPLELVRTPSVPPKTPENPQASVSQLSKLARDSFVGQTLRYLSDQNLEHDYLQVMNYGLHEHPDRLNLDAYLSKD